MSDKRYTVAVDFDGVIHSYITPWQKPHVIPDPPIPGAMEWLIETSMKFSIAITSTRNKTWRGRRAMQRWLRENLYPAAYRWASRNGLLSSFGDEDDVSLIVRDILSDISFPKHKPPALIYLDDRAWRFEGTFPTADEIHRARPWRFTAAPQR